MALPASPCRQLAVSTTSPLAPPSRLSLPTALCVSSPARRGSRLAFSSPVKALSGPELVGSSMLIRVSLLARILGVVNLEADHHYVFGPSIAGCVAARRHPRSSPLPPCQSCRFVQHVASALDRVFAVEAVDNIGTRVAVQRVGLGRAGKVLDIGEGVGAHAERIVWR